MVETDLIETEKGAALGIKVQMPAANLLVIRAEKGYLACGYLNSKTIEKLKESAVIISGVKNFEDMLDKKVEYVSKKAKELGINDKMTGRQALNLMI